MWLVLKKLALGLVLIAGASAILLLSDWNRRARKAGPAAAQEAVPRVAVFQFASRPVLDENVDGMIAGLAQAGFIDGKSEGAPKAPQGAPGAPLRTVSIRRFNSENDLPTANTIAKEIVGGQYDLVLTSSTPCLQTMANANKGGKVIHVFAAVTDPFGAGVGISRENPLDHPRHLVGVGTFQPVEATFDLARKMFPGLKRVGVAWNTAEACSEACLVKARKKCKELGIELLEANVENSAGVLEAAKSVAARGAQALWIGGDNTVEMAMDSLVSVAQDDRIPVFNNNPASIGRGVLLALGANYHEVGVLAGDMAARILKGMDPATVRIENIVPERLCLNTLALKDLRDPWQIPPDLLEKASAPAPPSSLEAPRSGAALARKWKIFLVRYSDSPIAEDATEGVKAGLLEAKLVAGRDYTLAIRSAQGDVPTLNGIFDAIKSEGADLVVTFSTPTLQVAMKKFDRTPIVFSVVANAVLAGAGRSESDHRPNVTGITTLGAFEGMPKILKECMPAVRRVGTVFTPSEVNSVFNKDAMVQYMKENGIEVAAVPAETSSEYTDAAAAMCDRGIDAVCQIIDNLSASCFASVAKAAERRNLPIFGFESSQAKKGAVLVLARDYFDAGREGALVAARVMRGESPANIPFTNLKKARLVVNLPQARRHGLNIPASVIERADEVIR